LKKIWVSFLFIGVLSNLQAWPRLGSGAQPVTQNAGNKTLGISVNVTSTTVIQVYTGVEYHREIFLENTNSTYLVYCGTSSSITATSGPRWYLSPKPSGFTTNATSNIYCIGEVGAPSIEVLGSREFDYKDLVPNP
jgi:hypothetical protein